jgi:hypothetical protein
MAHEATTVNGASHKDSEGACFKRTRRPCVSQLLLAMAAGRSILKVVNGHVPASSWHLDPMARSSNEESPHRWSARVTRESHALALEEGVFTWRDPRRIALSIKRSADASTARKSPPLRSAMSMLVFYINRAGKNLDPGQKRILEQAKDELRRLYGEPSRRADTERH